MSRIKSLHDSSRAKTQIYGLYLWSYSLLWLFHLSCNWEFDLLLIDPLKNYNHSKLRCRTISIIQIIFYFPGIYIYFLVIIVTEKVSIEMNFSFSTQMHLTACENHCATYCTKIVWDIMTYSKQLIFLMYSKKLSFWYINVGK